MNHVKRVLLGSIILWAILLSACGPSSTNSANTLSAIYTAAAQTIVAQDAIAQSAVEQTATPMPTDTDSILTPTDSGISSPTNLPTMAYSLPTSTSSGSSCNNSTYVSDVTITDGTVMSPGQTFVKTWALQNTGSCTWDTGFTIRFFSGDQMGGTSGPVSSSVAPGGQMDVSVSLTAPLTAGTYQGNWRLADDSGITFGEIIDVVIDVNGSETDTPAATATDTPTASATALTFTPTNTVQPTAVPTFTPTSTPKPPTFTPTPKPPTFTPTPNTPKPKPTAIPT
jgi:hypothetical protein